MPDLSVIEKPESGNLWDRNTVGVAVRRYPRWHYKEGDGNDAAFNEAMVVFGSEIKVIKRGS